MRVWMLCCFLITSFLSVQAQELSFNSGDVVFVADTGSDLTKAINQVTGGNSYTHVGLVEVTGEQAWIIHSDFERGVCKERLQDFQRTRPIVDLYSVTDLDSMSISQVIQKAHELLGEPYNTTYILSDTGFYCSEFVYHVFEATGVFELHPMTFTNPSTGATDTTWVKHYQGLGIAIPEGEPGCNPNGMASNVRLTFKGRWRTTP